MNLQRNIQHPIQERKNIKSILTYLPQTAFVLERCSSTKMKWFPYLETHIFSPRSLFLCFFISPSFNNHKRVAFYSYQPCKLPSVMFQFLQFVSRLHQCIHRYWCHINQHYGRNTPLYCGTRYFYCHQQQLDDPSIVPGSLVFALQEAELIDLNSEANSEYLKINK